MTRSFLCVISLFFSLCVAASEINDWQWHKLTAKSQVGSHQINAQLYALNAELLDNNLYDLADSSNSILVQLPDVKGNLVEYVLRHDSIMAPSLQQKYPMIRSYSGFQKNAPENTGRFDIGPNGFFAFYNANGETLYIDPKQQGYLLYQKGKSAMEWQDTVVHSPSADVLMSQHQARGPLIANGGAVEMVTYRLAVTTSDEYTTFYGSKTQALNGIVTTINRVNQIYQTDIAVKLELVANNDVLIFTANDPYDNGELDDTLSEVQNQIDTLIGASNYDVGHLMATSGAGLAALGVICADGAKAQGMTGIGTPQGDAFDVDYVAHELGHQFGANHTYNGSAGSCTTRESGSAYEPGSGVTIMGYAGICSDEDLASNSIAIFHSHSIDEINTHLTQGTGSTCGSLQDSGNKAPIANAGSDYTVPANTPFLLTGSATDANTSDNLSYAWEQLDLGSATASAAQLKDNGQGPMFRPYLPNSSATRYFPLLADVISGQVTKGDGYPTTDRTMTFRFIVRDGNGGVSFDTANVTSVSQAGPFTITSPDDTSSADSNNVITVNWNVANTNITPVSCANVSIMQTNSDATQMQTLLAQTPNDGTQQVTLMGSESNKARVMVKCATSTFYALSKEFELAKTLAVVSQQTLSVAEDSSITLSASQFSVVNQQAGSNLTLTIRAGTNYTFSGSTVTPSENYNGTLSVNITLSDGSSSTNYVATVQVTPVNDAPSVSGQQTLTVKEDESITLGVALFEVVDVDSTVFTLTLQAGDNYSTDANVVFPDENFNGLLEVKVVVKDQAGASTNFAAQITVTPVNDAPQAVNDSATAVQGQSTTINVIANDTDIDADVLTLTDVMYDGTGTAVISGNSIKYQSATSFTGQEQLVYSISDGNGGTAQGTLTIQVQAEPIAPPTNLDGGSSGGGSMGSFIYMLCLLAIGCVMRNLRRSYVHA
jgi:hypothetical protein